MKNRSALSGSGMFLTELLIAILVFAVASAICVRIFVSANFIANDSDTLNHAVIAAQNSSECFKAASGDLKEVAMLLDAQTEGEAVVLYLSSNWTKTDKASSQYAVMITRTSTYLDSVRGEVIVTEKDNDAEPLYRLSPAVIALPQSAETEVTP